VGVALVKLTQVERWILVNQCLILEKLYPDDAEDYARTREALEHGYELEYGWHTSHILSDGLSETECREVIDILEMFRVLGLFYEKHNKPQIDDWKLTFTGFDGNNETLQILYTQYVVNGGKFSEPG